MSEEREIGEYTLFVLAAFMKDTSAWRYGMELARAARVYPPGRIYPILTRLEAAGWLQSRPAADTDRAGTGQRRRRYYRLTAVGARKAGAIVYAERYRLYLLAAAPDPYEYPPYGSKLYKKFVKSGRIVEARVPRPWSTRRADSSMESTDTVNRRGRRSPR